MGELNHGDVTFYCICGLEMFDFENCCQEGKKRKGKLGEVGGEMGFVKPIHYFLWYLHLLCDLKLIKPLYLLFLI